MSDIRIKRGDDHESTITLTDSGSALDMTSCTVWVTVKGDGGATVVDDSRALFQAKIVVDAEGVGTSTTGLEIDGEASGGVLTLSFTAEETAAFVRGNFLGDVQVRDADDKVTTVLDNQRVVVVGDITQATS